MALNSAQANGVQFTNYFEPINEGAIQVLQFSSTPTPLGEVMPLFGALAGATRLGVAEEGGGGDDDVAAVAAVAGGAPANALFTLLLTNRNATGGFTQMVRFDGAAVAAVASVELLAATGGFSVGSFFTHTAFPVAVDGGWAAVPLPPFSVARVTVACASCTAAAGVGGGGERGAGAAR